MRQPSSDIHGKMFDEEHGSKILLIFHWNISEIIDCVISSKKGMKNEENILYQYLTGFFLFLLMG